jgi:hypothetical protein
MRMPLGFELKSELTRVSGPAATETAHRGAEPGVEQRATHLSSTHGESPLTAVSTIMQSAKLTESVGRTWIVHTPRDSYPCGRVFACSIAI